MLDEIRAQAAMAAKELLEAAHLNEKDLVVIGCSSSEISDHRIGSHSSAEIGQTVFSAIYEVFKEQGIYVAAQCCEHLNRALILEKEAAMLYGCEPVNVVPQLKAGSSLATAAYQTLRCPVAVESIKAHAGIDIGDTLIGMHLKAVAVPVRIKTSYIGAAHVVTARTRPKYIGGARACYDDSLG
ncbi:TIGR01440 family protein [Lacrimispora sp.]|uniref:TIGR01440 family protein n=1 Tax=Lacrimispora sp. TaxID=2719234 RepID=UPI0028AF2953|nr:TIGR01440 family protein [Lacrimispora sp.]